MATLSAAEQLLLELVNRDRMNPAAASARQGIDVNEDLDIIGNPLSTAPLQPLAPTQALIASSEAHALDLIAQEYFAIDSIDGTTLIERVRAAGWSAESGSTDEIGESVLGGSNFFPYFVTPALVNEVLAGLWASPLQRLNLLEPLFSETGVGYASGASDVFQQDIPFSAVVVQDFADGGRTYVTGVIYRDLDGDDFYDMGEGLGGVTVELVGARGGPVTTTSFEGGGYALEVPDEGTCSVRVSGTGIPAPIERQARVNDANVKLDVIINANATSGRDRITGTDRANFIHSFQGDDTIDGLDGNDRLFGNEGDDRLFGDDGADTLDGGEGDDLLNGGDGNDLLIGSDGNDTLLGHRGNDVLRGTFGDDSLAGRGGDDFLSGEWGSDTLVGGAGQDSLNGDSQNDLLIGAGGNDAIRGGMGEDTLRGGEGADILRGQMQHDRLFGQGGNDTLAGEAGHDTLDGGDGDDHLYGGSKRDVLRGGDGADLMDGGAGIDTLAGGEGDDTLLGGARDDRLFGEAGDDVLNGGPGDDFMRGGAGADRYVLSHPGDNDRVVFDGADVFDLSDMPLGPVYGANLQNALEAQDADASAIVLGLPGSGTLTIHIAAGAGLPTIDDFIL